MVDARTRSRGSSGGHGLRRLGANSVSFDFTTFAALRERKCERSTYDRPGVSSWKRVLERVEPLLL